MISFLSNSTPQTYKTRERDGKTKNVQREICQNIKNVLSTYPSLSEEQYSFFIPITFLNPENLNLIMSYMESECM